MKIRKIAEPGAWGDAYPAEMPQYQEDMNSRYMHDPAEFEPGSGEYKFFYGGGQLHVSPFHEHDELRNHADIDENHSGPIAVGYVSVDRGKATWRVSGNVALRGFGRILKDYTKQVGWQWGGITDLDGDWIDDSFVPKKSMRLLDNETGEEIAFDVQGKTAFVDGLTEDQIKVISKQFKIAEYPGGTNMNDRMDNYAPAGETYDMYSRGENRADFPEAPDNDQPTGTFKCPECSKLFNNWGEYKLHRQDENPMNEDTVDDGQFPELDLDKPLPPGYHEKRPYVMPLASVKEAKAYEEFEDYEKWLGIDDASTRVYGAYCDGEITGFAAVRENEILVLQGRRPADHLMLLAALQIHYPDLDAPVQSINERIAQQSGFVRTASSYKWAAGQAPKDMIDRPIPFIYDIQEDRIAVGHPGSRHSDIPGKFTPGGIVEGDYLPGGKVHIHTMTNMPYTVRHMIDLWYWSYPHMEVTGIELHDNAGNKTKLASSKSATQYLSQILDSPYEDGQYEVGDNILKIGTLETDDKVWLIEIEASKKGTGLGTKVIDSLRDYADHNNKHFAVRNVHNKDFFNRFSYLVPSETGWDTRYDYSRRQSAVSVGSFIKQVALADPAVWNAYKALHQAGGQVYVVGGAVRDALMQNAPKDIDLMVAGIPSEEVNHILNQLPGKTDLTGKNFGVYRYKEKGHEVEIALPRVEKSTGDRRVNFDVKVDHNLPVEDDLLRRDFTVNSMAVDLGTGKLIDPYGGADDIKHHRLHTTHSSSFQEDPTRLVRALVMAGRYGLQPDEKTRKEMKDNAHRIDFESPDAVQPILEKLFASNEPARAIRLAHDTGVLKHIFPEVDSNWNFDQNNPHHHHPLGEHLLQVLENISRKSTDPDLRLTGLLHDIGKPASAWVNPETGFNHYFEGPNGEGADHQTVGADMAEERLRALKWPSARIKRITHLIQNHMWPAFSSPKGARKYINRVGDEHADDLLTFRWADQHGKGQSASEIATKTDVDTQRGLVEQVRSAQQPTSQSALMINGNDILSLGVPAGPQVGKILRLLTDDVIENPSLNDPEALRQRAQEYANGLPES